MTAEFASPISARERLIARCWLSSLLLLAMISVGITLSPLRSNMLDRESRTTPGDLKLYQAMVEGVAAGGGYYDVMAKELRERNYPTASLFNWRMPLPLVLMAKLPNHAWSQALLGLVGLAVLLYGFDLVANDGSVWEAGGSMLALSGALMPIVLGDPVYLHELWSGLLIALSLCFYGRGQNERGAWVGLAALMVRELAAPYVVLMGLWAIAGRRWREVAIWVLGFVVFMAFFAWHVEQVQAHQLASDPAHEKGWVRCLGLPFVIATAQMNCYLLVSPQWVTALFLTAAAAGTIAWRSPFGRRVSATIAAYVAFFFVVGQDFNQYWGSMYAPILALAAGRSWGSVRRLWAQGQ